MSDEEFSIDSAVSEIYDDIQSRESEDDDDTSVGDEPIEPNDDSDDEPEETEEETDDEPEETEEEPEQVEESSPPPKSWSKDKAEVWAKIPDEAREYIQTREKQMLDGIEQYKQARDYAEYIDSAIAPYREIIKANGGDERGAIVSLFEHHKAITEGTLEQRQEAFIQIGIATGLIPQEGQPQRQASDPALTQLNQRLAAIERQEQLRLEQHKQAVLQQTQRQVDEFAASHPYFDELQDDISKLLKVGETLDSAYEKAVWMNPVTREKEASRIRKANASKTNLQAARAVKATSANVKTANTKGKPDSAPRGNMFDVMKETYKEIQARG